MSNDAAGAAYKDETNFVESNLLLSYQSGNEDEARYWLNQMSEPEARRFENLLKELRWFVNGELPHRWSKT